MRRGIVHIEAEIRWHDELDATLAGPGGGEGPVGLHSGGSFEVAALRQTAFEIVAGDISGSSADGVPDAGPSAGGSRTVHRRRADKSR